jgi:hypothetical protein
MPSEEVRAAALALQAAREFNNHLDDIEGMPFNCLCDKCVKLANFVTRQQAQAALAQAQRDIHDERCETRRETFVAGYCGCRGRRIAALAQKAQL